MLCLLVQMLRVVPTATWLAAFDAASLACMESFTPQGLGDILAAQVSRWKAAGFSLQAALFSAGCTRLTHTAV